MLSWCPSPQPLFRLSGLKLFSGTYARMISPLGWGGVSGCNSKRLYYILEFPCGETPIFFIEAPAQRTAKLSRRLPAGNFPRRKGWLFHVKIPFTCATLSFNCQYVSSLWGRNFRVGSEAYRTVLEKDWRVWKERQFLLVPLFHSSL